MLDDTYPLWHRPQRTDPKLTSAPCSCKRRRRRKERSGVAAVACWLTQQSFQQTETWFGWWWVVIFIWWEEVVEFLDNGRNWIQWIIDRQQQAEEDVASAAIFAMWHACSSEHWLRPLLDLNLRDHDLESFFDIRFLTNFNNFFLKAKLLEFTLGKQKKNPKCSLFLYQKIRNFLLKTTLSSLSFIHWSDNAPLKLNNLVLYSHYQWVTTLNYKPILVSIISICKTQDQAGKITSKWSWGQQMGITHVL